VIVLDASITAPFLLDGEQSPPPDITARILSDPLIAPPHWVSETGNLLLNAVRRKRITQAMREALVPQLRALGVTIASDALERVWTETIRFAEEHGLTIYDAGYLELAWRRRATLATLDDELLDAARALDIPVLTY
jgi:predicted nucleic acid-binding protein